MVIKIKKVNKSKSHSSFFGKISAFFKDKRLRIICGLILLFFAVFLTLAFISYLFTWEDDQSELYNIGWWKSKDITVENWAGKIGAFLSNLFIYKWFGIASFLIIFLFFLIGFRLLKIRLLPLTKSIKYSIIGIIWLSITLSYFFGNTYNFLGGAHGYFMSDWLIASIGKIGTFLFLLVCLFVFIILTFKNSLQWLKKLKNFIHKKEKESEDNVPLTIIEDDKFAEKKTTEEVIEDLTQDNVDEKEVELTIEKTSENESSKSITEPLVDYDPTLDISSYKFPSIDLLEEHITDDSEVSDEELINNKNRIVETLKNYDIQINKIKATIGPTVTLYQIVPAPGIRISKIKNLEDDIALSLSALGIRIIAPMPGKGTIGIEVPNQKPEIVSMRSIISSRKFQETNFELPLALGKTISNETYVVDLAKMPHLLVAGATGQGKSVGLNAMITSLLYKKHPSQLKFVLIDPKKVELTIYSKIENHFLACLPDSEEVIVTDTQKVIYTLKSLIIEMEQRYNLFEKVPVRSISDYNKRFIKRELNPENGHRFLPYIIIIIDEFADLIMTCGKEMEMPIARLAQKARSVGIHLIIATQRPSTNIITGTIKANFPVRISFKVVSMMDSRTILDSPGANQLVGKGDMLISDGSDMVRLQCAFIDIPEIEKITEHIGAQQAYPTPYLLPEYVDDSSEGTKDVDLQKRDQLFEDAARIVVIHQQGSTSLLQRKFSIGYNRAGRIMDHLEAAGIVGPFEGSKARRVLFADEYSLEQFLSKNE